MSTTAFRTLLRTPALRTTRARRTATSHDRERQQRRAFARQIAAYPATRGLALPVAPRSDVR